MNILGLTGQAGAGKSTVARMLVEDHGFTEVALADPLKRICRDVFAFTDEQLWGPSSKRNEPDARFYHGVKRYIYPDAPANAMWVPLTAVGAYALIDAQDFDRVVTRKWMLHRKEIGRNTEYVRSTTEDETKLHHFIIGGVPAPGHVVDHANGDGLDNRRINLRVCTEAENRRNEIKRSPETALSAFKGVTWDSSREKWTAKITLDGVTNNLGRFDSEAAAAVAYDDAAAKAWGSFARLNRELFLTPRHALQQLGTNWGRRCYDNVWVDFAIRAAWSILNAEDFGYNPKTGVVDVGHNQNIRGVVISDVRFPNEVEAIKAAGGKVWRILRPTSGLVGVAGQHSSEHSLDDWADDRFDAVLNNQNGPLEDLRALVKATMEAGR